MYDQMHYLLALEIARQRTREAEARARLRWGMDPEPSLRQRIATRLATLGRISLSRTAGSRDGRDRPLKRAFTRPSGGATA